MNGLSERAGRPSIGRRRARRRCLVRFLWRWVDRAAGRGRAVPVGRAAGPQPRAAFPWPERLIGPQHRYDTAGLVLSLAVARLLSPEYVKAEKG